jgi:oligopeptide/dipeptide ABC transporter ATP-binding protein
VTAPVLAARGVTAFVEGARGLRRVLDRAEVTVRSGSTFALLGESGSGKTLLFSSILGLTAAEPGLVAGSAELFGKDVLDGIGAYARVVEEEPIRVVKNVQGWARCQRSRLRGVLGRQVTMVPQDPATALSPFHTVGQMLERAASLGVCGPGAAGAREAALDWLRRVHMYGVEEVARLYARELSGGMAQRVALALALAPSPRLLVADEPTTGLDASLRIRVLGMLAQAVAEYSLTLVLITHDAEAARLLARDVAVLHRGRVVEDGPSSIVLDPGGEPKHPYTRYLLDAERFLAGEGAPGVRGSRTGGEDAPPGCPYRGACQGATASCAEEAPELTTVAPGHRIACLPRGGG